MHGVSWKSLLDSWYFCYWEISNQWNLRYFLSLWNTEHDSIDYDLLTDGYLNYSVIILPALPDQCSPTKKQRRGSQNKDDRWNYRSQLLHLSLYRLHISPYCSVSKLTSLCSSPFNLFKHLFPHPVHSHIPRSHLLKADISLNLYLDLFRIIRQGKSGTTSFGWQNSSHLLLWALCENNTLVLGVEW